MKNASDHIGEVLNRIKPEYLARVYKVTSYKDVDDFLEQVANLSGRLLKVGLFPINSLSTLFQARQAIARFSLLVSAIPPKRFEGNSNKLSEGNLSHSLLAFEWFVIKNIPFQWDSGRFIFVR